MIYQFKPNRVFRSYYGGKNLDKLSGKTICENSQFPEEWIASTVRAFNSGRESIIEGPSICENGSYFCDIIKNNPIGILGNNQYLKHGETPSILVKLLDSAERLFIQCHPTVDLAKKFFNSNFGKTECWYIISAEENACVYIGFKPEITKEKWQECFDKQDVDGMLGLMHKINVKSGDLVFVEGGVPHAIGGGCLLCELQEPTDYMVIPERKSKSGITLSDSKMHCGLGFERMMDCFIYEGFTEEELKNKYVRHPKLEPNKLETIVDTSLTDKFKMSGLNLNSSVTLNFGDSYSVGVVLDGKCELKCNGQVCSLNKGKSFFISANSENIDVCGKAKIIFCMPC